MKKDLKYLAETDTPSTNPNMEKFLAYEKKVQDLQKLAQKLADEMYMEEFKEKNKKSPMQYFKKFGRKVTDAVTAISEVQAEMEYFKENFE